jgi:hypothetical protein
MAGEFQKERPTMCFALQNLQRSRKSAYLYAFHAQQGAKLLQFAGDVPDSNRTVMRGAMHVPLVDKVPGAGRKTISAVRVTYFENRTGYRFPLCHQQLQSPVSRLHDL